MKVAGRMKEGMKNDNSKVNEKWRNNENWLQREWEKKERTMM